MKKTIYILALALFPACSVKKETAQIRQYHTTEQQIVDSVSGISLSCLQGNSLSNIRIYERITETDTLGRPVKKIQREYTVERRDSARQEIYSQTQENYLETNTSQTERKEEIRSVKKSALGRLLIGGIIAAGLAFAGYRLWRRLWR